MVKEKYYAIRIGEPRKSRPYLMVREDTMTPDLFNTRLAAKEAALKRVPNRTDFKTVAVNVCETKRT
jgi:hypothetical protein